MDERIKRIHSFFMKLEMGLIGVPVSLIAGFGVFMSIFFLEGMTDNASNVLIFLIINLGCFAAILSLWSLMVNALLSLSGRRLDISRPRFWPAHLGAVFAVVLVVILLLQAGLGLFEEAVVIACALYSIGAFALLPYFHAVYVYHRIKKEDSAEFAAPKKGLDIPG